MTTDRDRELADESEAELEKVLRAPVRARDATAVLTELLLAFDARRRRRETISIVETARAAARAKRA
jgi:hypothetical protein